APSVGMLQSERHAGVLPALLCPGLRRVAVLGLRDGVAAGRVAAFAEVEQIDAVEPEAAALAAARRYPVDNARILADRRLRLFRQDARSFVRSRGGSYDLILAQ